MRVPNTDNNTNTTNTDNNNKKRKIEAQKEEGLLKLEGMRVGGSRIVPKAVVRQVTGITGDWPIPDASGVALLYLLIDSEAEKPVPYAGILFFSLIFYFSLSLSLLYCIYGNYCQCII